MKISFKLWTYTQPLKQAVVLKNITLRERRGCLLACHDDQGNCAYGDASPLPGFSDEDLHEVTDQLKTVTNGLLRNIPRDFHRLKEWLDNSDWWPAIGGQKGQEPFPSVRFAFESAMLHLWAKHCHQDLACHLFEKPCDTLKLQILLTGSACDVLTKAASCQNKGYTAFKLKVGQRPLHEDIDIVCELCSLLGHDTTLRLDANQHWDLTQAVQFAAHIPVHAIDYIEEPVSDIADLHAFFNQTGLSVAMDESLPNLSMTDLCALPGCKAIILKPSIRTGIFESITWARGAQKHGITPTLSSAFESGVGMHTLILLARGIHAPTNPVGLDTYHDLAKVPSLPINQGHLDCQHCPQPETYLSSLSLKDIRHG